MKVRVTVERNVESDNVQSSVARVGRASAAELLRRGQGAARAGDRVRAERLFRAALIADPESAEARLWLGAISEDVQESVDLLTQAVRLQPDDRRAAAALQWACERAEAQSAPVQQTELPVHPQVQPLPSRQRSFPLLKLVTMTLACVVVVMGTAFLLNRPSWAEPQVSGVEPPVEVAPASASDTQMIDLPPLYPPAPTVAATAELSLRLATPTGVPTAEPTATLRPTALPPTVTPQPTTVPPTATPLPQATPAPTAAPQQTASQGQQGEAAGGRTGKWIEVILSKQVAIAWNGNTAVRRMVVSTGVAQYPTVTGTYRIYLKLRSQRMIGPGYNLPNVPHVMYFYRGYALHGTYWHNNFGRRMSHGCINLNLNDAAWLFNWTGPVLPQGAWTVWATAKNPGTLVVIHW